MYLLYIMMMMDNEMQHQLDVVILHYNHYHQDHQMLKDSNEKEKKII